MYNLMYSKQAAKYIRKQDKPTKERLKEALLTLAENPYKRGVLDISSLQGVDGAFRLRVGDFRIVYEIKNEELIIYIISVGSSGDIYK
ncbi:type II toxin-antitoxin system RelE/ParE family toxin [Bacillus sp. 31A1R]|uniref:Type II toxin-antitoxin system RelE/ParE family toxin n=1 Tax=Robertmurraya mangrovi TaxID=3098077 RepID=A0ABU5J1M7_9BACI|nr:type II toxin-antitoxin system RelE/ParE family toxin [Bacillus sp. 31A1R]MDZ5473261.1 type II toxin-antitoxin system RelE/ParE family toxin [Bacillus sp. 31A1R]